MSYWTSGSLSKNYELFRINYPAALFEFVTGKAPTRAIAIDVGCGTGQAVRGLQPSFGTVLGVDPSPSQISSAFTAANVSYVVGGAESFQCPAELVGKVDLITIAQAMHWFDIPSFARHCEKLLRPGGVVAAWTYPLCRVSPSSIEKLLDEMNAEMHDTGSWPRERRFVDNNYSTLLPLFSATSSIHYEEAAVFPVVKKWALSDFLQYLNTMSGVGQYRKLFPEKPDLLDVYARKMIESAGPDGGKTEVTATFSNHVFILRKCGPAGSKL